MLELVAIVFIVMIAWAAVTAAAVLIKLAVWLVLLPFRALFAILFLPLLLIKALVSGLFMLVAVPVLAIAGVVAALALAAALLVPALPIVLIAFLVWFVIRATQRPAVAR